MLLPGSFKIRHLLPLLLAAAFVAEPTPYASEPVQATLLGCESKGSEWLVELDGRVILLEEFLQKVGGRPQDEVIEEAVELQVKHLMGFLQNDPDQNELGRFALGAWRQKPEIRSKSRTRYPFSLTIDPWRDGPQGSHPYVTAAIQAGRTAKGSPALEVKYRTKVKLSFCPFKGRKEYRPSTIPLPIDPFLGIWYVHPDKRRPMRWGRKFQLVSPCATNEMADFGNASQFWYLWNPRGRGTDEEGHDYDCRAIAPEKTYAASVGLKYLERTPEIDRRQNFASLFEKAGTLSATAIFGKIAYDGFRKFEPAQFVKALSSARAPSEEKISLGSRIWNSLIDVKDRKTIFEPGAMEFLMFLRHLSSLAELKEVKALEQGQEHLVIGIKGVLKQSQKPIQLRVFYGHTSIDSGKGQHSKLLLDALQKDDVLIYNGHAGLGANLKIDQIGQFLGNQEKVSRAVGKKPYQLVALFNCYSYSHFGEDILERRKGRMTDLLLSGTQDAGAKYVLGILKMLDRSFSGESVDLSGSIARYIPPRSFAVMKRAIPLTSPGSRH